MAENKPGCGSGGTAGIFARRVQKQLSRAQEKVLQKLGKTVETKDEQFEQCSQNLHKQQSDGNRLFKDIKAYFNAVKVMHETSKRLSQSLKDVYETEWQGMEDLMVIMESEDLLWNDYEEKLADQAVRTMENYISQFPEAKERVSKRGRKLVDYDSSRHHLEALQNAKKKDEIKITKAEEEFHKAQTVFEDINRELREELPVLYQSRIGCYVTVFQNISNLRDVFYKEMSTLNNDLYNVMKKLETQHSDKAFIVKGWESNASETKKRRSLMISAPIPCNTAFPSDHTSSLGPLQSNKDATAVKTDDQGGSRPTSLLSSEGSEPAVPELNSDSSSDPAAQEPTGTGSEGTEAVQDPRENSGAEAEAEKKVDEEREKEGSVAQTTEDAVAQTPSQDESNGRETTSVDSDTQHSPEPVAEPGPEPEVPLWGTADCRPTPAPRTTPPSTVQSHQTSDSNGIEPEPTSTEETKNPPGFLYKGVATESHFSTQEGELQFEEGDVILVLNDGEEMPEGMAKGVKESDWIQHGDPLDHSGIFMESWIQRAEAQ
ncbi:hypothetical protein AGOR_G00161580 [Albula goreensis]|uniref:BAR domain-containing protein n=1 Tax=Albula goreensis TaxID=1534307 RepID=A0A8T3D0I2_9TELE|nr:hypothetical protein AGOR_G00161580 [Albula goreensis]